MCQKQPSSLSVQLESAPTTIRTEKGMKKRKAKEKKKKAKRKVKGVQPQLKQKETQSIYKAFPPSQYTLLLYSTPFILNPSHIILSHDYCR